MNLPQPIFNIPNETVNLTLAPLLLLDIITELIINEIFLLKL